MGNSEIESSVTGRAHIAVYLVDHEVKWIDFEAVCMCRANHKERSTLDEDTHFRLVLLTTLNATDTGDTGEPSSSAPFLLNKGNEKVLERKQELIIFNHRHLKKRRRRHVFCGDLSDRTWKFRVSVTSLYRAEEGSLSLVCIFSFCSSLLSAAEETFSTDLDLKSCVRLLEDLHVSKRFVVVLLWRAAYSTYMW